MEAFLGKWKAGPEDYENVEAYIKAFNHPELTRGMDKGAEVVIVKEGDMFVLTSSQGGVQNLKEMFNPDGSIQFVDSKIPDYLVQVTHRVEDGKIRIEGTVGGEYTKSVMYIMQGDKFILEVTTGGVTMRTKYSRV